MYASSAFRSGTVASLLTSVYLYSAQSTLTNKARLKLLHRREEHLQDLFSGAREDIAKLAGDDGRYVQFLEGITLQALLQILEPAATVHVRSKDTELFNGTLDSLKKQFTEISGREVDVQVEGSLSDDM